MKSVSADIILFSETNLDWKNFYVATSTAKHHRNIYEYSRQISSNSNQTYDTPYQPGGTCIISTNKMVARHHSVSTDPTLGRWSILRLNLRDNKRLTIICCYQVCNQTLHSMGPKTALNQQWSLLKQQGHSHPNPRRQFYKDLDRTLALYTEQGDSIILAGDFNTSIGNDPSGLDRLLNKFHLSDTLRQLHGSYQCATHSRGSKTIDYIFASQDILHAIQRGAILAFDSIIPSDHRPLFIDINIHSAFHASLPSLLKPPQRSLLSTNTRNCSKYVACLYSSLQSHKVFERIQRLKQLTAADLNQAIQLAEAIDRDVTRLMLASEHKLQRPSPTPFSSELAQACIRVSILKLRYSELKHNKSHTLSIQHLQSRLQEPLPLPATTISTKTALRDARQSVREIRRNAVSAREAFLLDREADKSVSKIIKRIRRAEELKRGYAKLRYLLKPTQSSMVTHLEIPTDNTPPKQATSWTRITDPEQVSQHLFQRNIRHFGAAHGTPFTVTPLSDDFDWSGRSSCFPSTLAGNPPHYDNPLLDQLLSRLQRRISPAQPTITMHELIRRFRRWKESTTTSPSRRHLGHYKALLPSPNFDLDEFRTQPEGQILSVHLALLNFCATTGYSLSRWHKIVTMMIPKESNNFKIHRLRVIHLYEADLTALFSLWSKKMILQATAQSTLNPGSYGARPGKTSTDPAFVNLLQQEIATITRTNLAIAPNDASQCYDRIIPNHAILSCMSHGMSPTAASCIGSTLHHAKYHLRTALNESTTYWTNTTSTPIYGTGQGSGISPGICCVTFSDLFDVHSSIATGATYSSPTSSQHYTLYNIGYVDDTTTTVNDHHLSQPLPLSSLLQSIQSDLQLWANLLHLSGGALELSKTELFLMYWKFNKNGTPYLISTADSSISLQDPSSPTPHTVIASNHNLAYKLLGFHLSPTLSMSVQYNQLYHKAHKIANAISGSSVTRRESYLSYFAIFLPSVSYVLPLTTFTLQQCQSIQRKPVNIFLQKSGFPSTMHRSIVYAPRSCGGLGFKHLFTVQGISQITKLIQTLRTPGQSQTLLKLAITEWQIHSGCSTPLLLHPKQPCKHLEGTWLSSTRTFLASINGSIQITDMYCPTSTIANDVSIMDSINQVPKLGRKRIMHLNFCRLHLQVHFLSEITNVNGTHLVSGFWSGDSPTLRPYPPRHRYPRQASPSAPIWSLWRSVLRKLFCYPRSTRLRCPLLTCSSSPHSSPSAPSPSLTPLHSFPLYLHTLPSWQQSLLTHAQFPVSPANIIQLFCSNISSSELLAASDGGRTNDNATFGWTLRHNATTLATCFGPVHGHTPTSYRAEATGLLSLLLFLRNLLDHTPVSSLPLTLPIYIDNSALCTTLNNNARFIYSSPSDALSPERDLILQITATCTSDLLVPRFIHIKSHQDRHAQSHSLSYPAQANCAADHLATHAFSLCQSCPQTPLYPAASCQFLINNSSITRSLPHLIHYSAHTQALRQYIISSHDVPDDVEIDWSFFKTFCLQNSFRHVFALKWIHRLLPVGKVLHRRNPSESPFCPACGLLENHTHFLTCSHLSRTPLKQHIISTLRRSVSSVHTDPILLDIVIDGINSFLTDIPPSFHHLSPSYRSLIYSQQRLGWDHLLRGLISTKWHSLHLQYLRDHPPSPSSRPRFSHPLSWLSSVLTSIHSMWIFRCQQRHSTTLAIHEAEQLRQARIRLSELYAYRTTVLPTDRHIFRSSLEEHLKDDLPSILAWISNHSPYIISSHRQALHLNITNTRTLTSFFPH